LQHEIARASIEKIDGLSSQVSVPKTRN